MVGVKVFSASRARERENLGEVITGWLHANPGLQLLQHAVLQSSDEAFHCLTIVLFFERPDASAAP
jgi:hypothetical protein